MSRWKFTFPLRVHDTEDVPRSGLVTQHNSGPHALVHPREVRISHARMMHVQRRYTAVTRGLQPRMNATGNHAILPQIVCMSSGRREPGQR